MYQKKYTARWLILMGIFLIMGIVVSYTEQVAAILPAESEGSSSENVYLPLVESFKAPASLSFEPFATGFTTSAITDIAHAGDGRLYITEREGKIRIVEPNGTLVATPFLDITDRVAAAGNWELGLLGLAFHPNYPATPQLFVAYTREGDFRIVVSRFNVDPGNLDQAIKSSEVNMLSIAKTPDNGEPSGISPVHNGGDLTFGPDGYLYVGFGDGGPDPNFGSTDPHDPANHGQRTDVLLGKIIRIDVNPNTPGNVAPDCAGLNPANNYSIPSDNPYVAQDGCAEIWALGLRNPWRMSFDALTGDLYIGDVGEWIFEEIDFIPAGESGQNFGWRCWEGTFDQTLPGVGHPVYDSKCGPAGDYDFPIFEYDSAGPNCAVTGGFVYRGTEYAILQGFYVLADFCTGNLWGITRVNSGNWVSVSLGQADFLLSTFGEGVDGELYAGGYLDDTLYKVTVP
ncbi:PQQ-dependent sugar dehydrogenase [Candidatus Leptofilum sp.]|uniref:PQQ-dependent sugar dehydrogenase n=1 Tax=Candidatus Leptofilum sp. TaxID=3241576 RepID=UPI003B5C2F72